MQHLRRKYNLKLQLKINKIQMIFINNIYLKLADEFTSFEGCLHDSRKER